MWLSVHPEKDRTPRGDVSAGKVPQKILKTLTDPISRACRLVESHNLRVLYVELRNLLREDCVLSLRHLSELTQYTVTAPGPGQR